MEQVFGHVAALFLHLEGDLDREGHALHCRPIPGLVLVGVLFGDAVGGGEVAHVDRHGQIAGGHTLLILVDDDGGLAGIDIVIGRNDRQLQLLVEELHGDEVAPGVAHSLKENGRLAVRIDVAVFGHPNVGIQTADGDLGGVGIGVVNGDAALGRAVVLLRNDTAELLGDVVDDDGIERIAGVKLSRRGAEGIVGVAACGNKVVGDHGILGLLVKRLAIDLVDGHTVDGGRAVVGRAGIGLLVLVIELIAVDGELDAGNLREAAQRDRRAEGRGLERLEQLRAGDIDDRNGVAEGQNRKDVVLGHIAGLHGRADAAAVRDGKDVLCGGLGDGAGILLGEVPDHCVGDEVAVVGLLGAVARLLSAVQLNLGGRELLTVLSLDVVDDLLRGGLDRLVLLAEAALAGGNEIVFRDLLRGIIDHDHADVGKLRAGGLDGLILLALLHHGVGVAVNDEIQPGDLFIQVIGAIRNGGFVHAEVSKADNHVCAGCLERVDLRLRVLPNGRLGRIGQEGQTLDERGIGLCLRLGRLQTEEADLDAALFDDLVCLEDGLVLRIKHIGAENREFRLLHVFLKLRIAIVKLVVAEADHVIAGQVHQLHSIRALAQ